MYYVNGDINILKKKVYRTLEGKYNLIIFLIDK